MARGEGGGGGAASYVLMYTSHTSSVLCLAGSLCTRCPCSDTRRVQSLGRGWHSTTWTVKTLSGSCLLAPSTRRDMQSTTLCNRSMLLRYITVFAYIHICVSVFAAQSTTRWVVQSTTLCSRPMLLRYYCVCIHTHLFLCIRRPVND